MAGHVEEWLASDVGAVHLSAAHAALIELVLGKSELREALTNDAGQGWIVRRYRPDIAGMKAPLVTGGVMPASLPAPRDTTAAAFRCVSWTVKNASPPG